MTSASTYSDKAEQPSEEPTTSQANHVAMPEEILNLPKRPSPLAEEKCLLHGKAPQEGQVIVLMNQIALGQIVEHSGSNFQSELGGFLLGQPYREGNSLIIDVKATVAAHTEDRGQYHFKFSADTWRQAHQEKDQLYPDTQIVGWYHTHPGFGPFFSADDVIVQSSSFRLPWHVGLVVDPVQQQAALFGWENGTIAPVSGYYELTNLQTEPVAGWKAVRTSVSNISESEMVEQSRQNLKGQTREDSSIYMPDNQWLALSPSYQKIGLIVGTLALALALFLLIGWVLPLNRQVKEMETVILNMSNSNVNPNAHACPDPRLRFLSPINGNAARQGSEVTFIGTVVYPEAARYNVETRLAGSEAWQELGSQRRSNDLGTLAAWNTREAVAGTYEVRLTAVDNNNLRLPNSPNCVIEIQLLP